MKDKNEPTVNEIFVYLQRHDVHLEYSLFFCFITFELTKSFEKNKQTK